jgi:hypothetical protein
MNYITEAIAVIFSSSGVIGAVIVCLLRRAMKNAEAEAEKRRSERLEEELLRYELDSATSSLLVTLARYARRLCSEEELEIAEANYTACVSRTDLTIKRHYLENKK